VEDDLRSPGTERPLEVAARHVDPLDAGSGRHVGEGAGREVIDDQDLDPLGDKAVDEVAADEPRPAGHERAPTHAQVLGATSRLPMEIHDPDRGAAWFALTER
jgi:hypothetical protein